jgi:16S rRNA processing protein RimM
LEDPVVIGVVGAPHGVGGTLRVSATSDGRHLREGVEPLLNGERRRILHARQTAKGFLVDLEGIESREDAQALRHADVLLDRCELDELGKDEFYVGDLIGLTALDVNGDEVGYITDAFPTPAHEILVIERGRQEFLVPFTEEHVPEVRLGEGRLLVNLPEE